jgi:hypothetical protein
METFTYHCVDLMGVCEINQLDYSEVMDQINASDISFGTNDDTLITRKTLESILSRAIEFGELPDNTMISLGS